MIDDGVDKYCFPGTMYQGQCYVHYIPHHAVLLTVLSSKCCLHLSRRKLRLRGIEEHEDCHSAHKSSETQIQTQLQLTSQPTFLTIIHMASLPYNSYIKTKNGQADFYMVQYIGRILLLNIQLKSQVF